MVATPTRGSNIFSVTIAIASHPDLVVSCETAPGINSHGST